MSAADPLTQFPAAQEFLAEITPLLPAYQCGVFTYVALIRPEGAALMKGRLELHVERPAALKQPLVTSSLHAAQVGFGIGSGALEMCLRSTLAGEFLPFFGHDDQLVKLLPRGQEDRPDGRETPRLVLSGISLDQLVGASERKIKRELQEYHFDSISDLLHYYDLSIGQGTSFEIVPGPVAAIRTESEVRGQRASIRVALAAALPVERFRVTVRNADPSIADTIVTASGENIPWSLNEGGYRVGVWTYNLRSPAILNCRALYAGDIQAEVQLAEPESLPNPRRMLFDLVDPQLTRLKELLTAPTNKQARDFEAGVALLFQLLGFSPAHIGAMSGWTDAPAIFVTSPTGDSLIVECTIGVPDDSKLTMLISRLSRLREARRHVSRNYRPQEVIATLVTPCTPEQLAAIHEKVQEHGILLLCRPQLVEALELTQFEPNASTVLQYWRNLLPLNRLR